MKPTEQLGLVGVLVTIGILAIVSFVIGIDTLKLWVETAGVWGPLVFILLKASTVIVVPLSGSPLYPIGGLLFGFEAGVLYAVMGDCIGYTVTFYLSRIFGYPLVRKLIAGNEQSMLARIVKHVGTMKGFLHTVMTCFALPELISYGTGLSKLSYWKFISVMLPFSAVISSALVLFGSLIGEEHGPLLTFGLPVLGFAIIGTGVWFFLRSMREKETPSA